MYSTKILYLGALLALTFSCTGANRKNELSSPINIITSKVKYSIVEKPRTVIIRLPNALFPPPTLKNTGDAIIVTISPLIKIPPVTFTGPLLNNERYSLHHQMFYVNQSLGRSGHEINGKGYPIEGLKIFFKQKYNNIYNATKYHDGILVFSQPVKVNDLVNPLFFGFGAKLREYKGSYYDPVMKKQISSATCLTSQPNFYSFISYSQFKAFQKVLGNDGKPLNCVPPIYPQGSREVEGTRGLIVKLNPFGITIPLP